MVRRFLHILTFTVATLLGLASCNRDDDAAMAAYEPQRNAEVSVGVRFNLPSSKAGDPGSAHPEFVADWAQLVFYFVYDNGTVLAQSVSKDNFQQENTFMIYEGNVTVYAAAFPEGHTPRTTGLTPGDVRNMTADDARDIDNLSDRMNYMLGFFSGISSQLTVSEDVRSYFSVVLNRIVAKVDMQWDVQPGIDAGNFVNAAMSAVTFKGYSTGYIFPTAAEATTTGAVQTLAVRDGTVSERNGRAYFYSFPGTGCGFDFYVAYTQAAATARSQNYSASFDSALEGDVWYKVNLTVRGTTVDASSDPVTITIGG